MSTINNVGSTTAAYTAYESKAAAAKESTDKKAESSNKNDTGVVYEKGSAAKTSGYNKTNNAAIVQKMKADAEQRTSQLRSLVEQMMSQQGAKIGQADSIWSFLAKGNFTVSAAAKAQAQADIAEDGYWGVNQTSDRIVDFAKALSGGDASKADELLEAFKKGYKQATGAWGKSLPDISSRTYDAVVEKFDEWKNGASDAEKVE